MLQWKEHGLGNYGSVFGDYEVRELPGVLISLDLDLLLLLVDRQFACG